MLLDVTGLNKKSVQGLLQCPMLTCTFWVILVEIYCKVMWHLQEREDMRREKEEESKEKGKRQQVGFWFSKSLYQTTLSMSNQDKKAKSELLPDTVG